MTSKASLRAALLALAGLVSACGGGGGDSSCLIPDFCDGGGSGGSSGGSNSGVTAAKARLKVLGPINDATGTRYGSGQLVVAPSSRTLGFVARLEDIRNTNNPRPLAGYDVNLDVLSAGAAYTKARSVVLSSDGVCPATGGARGATTDSSGEVTFCFVAPPTSEVDAGDELPLSLRASAFLPTTAGSTSVTAVRDSFALYVENPSNSYTLTVAGPNGEPTDAATVGAGETLSGFTATLASDTGAALPSPRPFVRLVSSLGDIVGTTASGGTVNSRGVLNFGYKAGCPESAATAEVVTLTAAATVGGEAVEQEYNLNVVRRATTLSITLPSGGSSIYSGDTLQGINYRLVRTGGGSVAGTSITVQAAVVTNGVATPVGKFIEPVSGDFGNPLTLPVSSTGSLVLNYQAESGLRSNQTVTLTAGASDDTLCIRSTATSRTLQVQQKGTGSLVLLGDSGEPSGGISLGQEEIGSLVIRALDGRGNAVPGVAISLSATSGRIEIPGSPGASTATTGADGSLLIDYVAPSAITEEGSATLTASGTVDGRALTGSYRILLVPPTPPSAPVLTLTGPGEASPGIERTGYVARLQRLDGTAVQGTTVNLSATNGTVTVYEAGTPRPGVTALATDATGKLSFSLTPSSSLSSDTTAVITGTVASGQALSTECSSNADAVCSRSSNVTVRKDRFQFTAPLYGAAVAVGAANAQALNFAWQTADGSSVAECVDLSVSFTGAGDASYGLIVGSDPTPQTQKRRAQLNASGAFSTPISVYSDRSGFLEITARENRGCVATASGPLTATTGVQFFDEVCGTASDGRNCVDLSAPVRVLTSPDSSGAQRTATLTLDVRNNAYQPIDGAPVSFTITSPVSCAGALNERVFPGGGTTNANGTATTQYFVPNFSPQLANGTSCQVEIQGCVRGRSGSDPDAVFCSTRTVIVQQPTP